MERYVLQMSRKTHPSSDGRNPSCCRLCGLVQLGTVHIVTSPQEGKRIACLGRGCLWKIFKSSLPRKELHVHVKLRLVHVCESYERPLNNFRALRALIIERQSHFEGAKQLKIY